jgi:hypothetical protein
MEKIKLNSTIEDFIMIILSVYRRSDKTKKIKSNSLEGTLSSILNMDIVRNIKDFVRCFCNCSKHETNEIEVINPLELLTCLFNVDNVNLFSDGIIGKVSGFNLCQDYLFKIFDNLSTYDTLFSDKDLDGRPVFHFGREMLTKTIYLDQNPSNNKTKELFREILTNLNKGYYEGMLYEDEYHGNQVKLDWGKIIIWDIPKTFPYLQNNIEDLQPKYFTKNKLGKELDWFNDRRPEICYNSLTGRDWNSELIMLFNRNWLREFFLYRYITTFYSIKNDNLEEKKIIIPSEFYEERYKELNKLLFSKYLVCDKCQELDKIKSSKKKICPNCNKISSSVYCSYCGSELKTPNYCYKCDLQVETPFCGKCGSKIYLYTEK